MSHEVHESIQPTDMCQTMCTEPSPKAAMPPSPCLPHRGLENLHNDVFNAILETLLSDPGRNAIKNLSCVSRGLRNSCVPVLFRDCLIRTHTTHNLDLPPVYARPFIRHVIFIQRYWLPGWHDNFGFELQHLPNIHTVTFRTVDYGVPWYIIATCLGMPHITSIRFQCNAMWTNIQPFSQAEVAQASNRLTALAYIPYTWRESASALEKSDLAAEYMLEAACLSALVFGMTATAESLTLPFETAPLARMSEFHWPRLQALSLYGRAVDGTPTITLSSLVGGMPSLRRLSFQVAASTSADHTGEQISSSSFNTVLHLRSLTIAYPDPDDAIFSIIGAILTHLSRICPSAIGPDTTTASTARDLELVYQADNSEEDLLHYLISETPYLAHLEIHRYRQDRNSCVPYGRIASILTGLRSLRTFHLNLNFEETCKLYCLESHRRESWRQKLEAIGFEILHIMQTGPELAFIALLHHRQVDSQWVEFYPSWHAKGLHVDWDYAGLRGDSESLPYVPFICR
ncbi:uncharacterized protein TRAVEDRAFT_52523 [Trametes versicolor FP-101664 SS1]|uniref:uncharacterized protein n=1 Tax=Trametes versicolor (strain FP-101664) TaxID=717944 RepID=UPI0004621494|nr:uncharacterized protein TRAVEDRAFT_52523 [Trametes versicolor FP-101664 SS1]EIW53393.1 hypothetical protein TRAVEDRAFT_52523 [Trametes versicolor FP-101664 SS1]